MERQRAPGRSCAPRCAAGGALVASREGEELVVGWERSYRCGAEEAHRVVEAGDVFAEAEELAVERFVAACGELVAAEEVDGEEEVEREPLVASFPVDE